jgi:hypothetical protein
VVEEAGPAEEGRGALSSRPSSSGRAGRGIGVPGGREEAEDGEFFGGGQGRAEGGY